MIPDCSHIADLQKPLCLCRLTEQLDTELVRRRIAECCNEPTIYNRLFRRMLDGRSYSPNDAANFIHWAAKGWRDQTHCVFVALDSDGLPVASCDIKTATRDDDEIGYWRSVQVPGSMTAIVGQMLCLAIADGFTRFHAYVEPKNVGSVAVLERLGFRLEICGGPVGRHLYRRHSGP